MWSPTALTCGLGMALDVRGEVRGRARVALPVGRFGKEDGPDYCGVGLSGRGLDVELVCVPAVAFGHADSRVVSKRVAANTDVGLQFP